MMNIIPITPASIDLITKLNNGVRPSLDPETFYVYRGEDEHAEIIDADELKNRDKYPEWMTIVKMLYIGK